MTESCVGARYVTLASLAIALFLQTNYLYFLGLLLLVPFLKYCSIRSIRRPKTSFSLSQSAVDGSVVQDILHILGALLFGTAAADSYTRVTHGA